MRQAAGRRSSTPIRKWNRSSHVSCSLETPSRIPDSLSWDRRRVRAALIVPLAVLPLATMTSSLSTARVQPLAVSVSGSAVALPTPRLGVIILPPDSSMNPVVGGANGEDFGTQAGDSADLRRTVNLGDIASLRANGEMPPVVIAMDGRMPVGGELGPNDPNLAGTTSGSPPSGSAGPNVVSLPSAPRMEVEGNVDSTEGSITVQIPIDALTQSVRLVLHPPLGLPNGDSTVLGKISLIDPSGQTLAEIEPSPNTDSASPEDLTVAMENAPAGGQLVVRVARVPGVQSVAGSLPPSTFQSNIPFLLDVQRQDQPSTETSAPTTSEPGWFGTFALTSAGPSGQSSPSASSVSTGDPSSDAANGDQATEVPPAGTPINIGSQDDGYYVRLATGPPVSRSSGPLGPVLAASDTDPTPPVDRHERALLQEIPSLDRENDSEDPADSISRGRWAVVQVEEDLSQDQSGGRHVTVVLGAGGFPMKVTSRLSGDRAGPGWSPGCSARARRTGVAGGLAAGIVCRVRRWLGRPDRPGVIFSRPPRISRLPQGGLRFRSGLGLDLRTALFGPDHLTST